ncbi:hypothetical protein GP486_005858 [Trichoglossum hirsutum]|uniref:Uncharacterized protein n=1 Tax=Trichoglossum hirsutum TaxID=265104 RepID=A0A9P8L8F9_9PEZI|nr:hypothetical protein GP486_005858 [Trichoglossum hirsutum]
MSPYPSPEEHPYARIDPGLLGGDSYTLEARRETIQRLLKERHQQEQWSDEHLRAVCAVFFDNHSLERIADPPEELELDWKAIRKAFTTEDTAVDYQDIQSIARGRWHRQIQLTRSHLEGKHGFLGLLSSLLHMANRYVPGKFYFRFVQKINLKRSLRALKLTTHILQDGRLEWSLRSDCRPLSHTIGPSIGTLINISPRTEVQHKVREAATHIALAQHAADGYRDTQDSSLQDQIAQQAVEGRLWQKQDQKLFYETFVFHIVFDGTILRICISAASISTSYLQKLDNDPVALGNDYDGFLKIRRTRWLDFSKADDLEDMGEMCCRIVALVKN